MRPVANPKCSVALSRGRGSKPYISRTRNYVYVSPSHEGVDRNMDRMQHRVSHLSRPLTRAWIETLTRVSALSSRSSRPLTRAWIETMIDGELDRLDDVALSRGRGSKPRRIGDSEPTRGVALSRGRGSKRPDDLPLVAGPNSRPLTRAWIET